MAKEIQALPPQYSPQEVEDKIYLLWEKSGYFNPDRADRRRQKRGGQRKTYSITVPPPNITGSLHMGHALNATIQDILIRKKRMEGLKTLWLPGTDHAGIATQNVVEKELKKEGLTRNDLGREKFLEKIWQWKERYGHIILDQFKKLGASMDWSRTRFTMDQNYQEAVREAFMHYYQKGWIYLAERVINWCPRCATSLSDLELEYREAETILYYLRYPVVENPKSEIQSQKQIQNSKFKTLNSQFVVVATTRPETMLGDAAVAVNPKDERYKNLVGKYVLLPIQNREIPIVADPEIEKEFGTGAVKVTPAHDLLDAEIGERHKLPVYKVIGPDGKMTKAAGAACEGLKAGECREKVVEELKRLGLLEKEVPYKHNIARCYRCDTKIEPIPSIQWFLKMDKLAADAIKIVKAGNVKFHPKRWEKIYLAWLRNVKDWCISRQIWWGHRLPVFYCVKSPEGNSKFQIPNSQPIQNSPPQADSSLAEKSPRHENFIVSALKPETCPFCKNCEMERSPDVLDTWFSSALWPFAALGWPQKTKDLQSFYPTSVLSTARDIINLWVARMVFSGLEFMGKEPFKDVIIHATILTKEGKRMSKSLGTGVDPMDLISRYGADATRFGLIWQAMGGQDIHWGEEHVVAGRKFCNKIWNAARFVLLQTESRRAAGANSKPSPGYRAQIPKPKTPADKKILMALKKTKKEVNARIEKYEFGHALHTLYDFFWHDFCDVYLEKSKGQMSNVKCQMSTKTILLYVLAESLKLLHPFMPFITEEIWGRLPKDKSKKIKDKRNLLIVADWPK